VEIRKITRTVTPELVLANYPRGMFPMANPGYGVITWHCPNPRAVIPLDRFHISRSLERTLRLGRFTATFDTAFAQVIDGCAQRADGGETWIDQQIRETFLQLHRMGKAHSVEIWVDGVLAGGLYGLQIGGAFFAESKFHRVRDMSKVALAKLVERLRGRGFVLLEVQYVTEHLAQFGAVAIPHSDYIRRLEAALALDCTFA
jgi:leucyl/phenylalanyl-tRNA--protein transferase